MGTDEASSQPGYISIDAPMARALLGKRIDDEVEVQSPEGSTLYDVVEIEYSG